MRHQHARFLTFAHFRLLDYQIWTTLLDNSPLVLGPVHPLAGDTFLPAIRLVLLLLGGGLDPVLSIAGTMLLPGADLLPVFSLWDLNLGLRRVHQLLAEFLLRVPVLGKHLILPGDGLDPVHPLVGDTFLPADRLVLLPAGPWC